ncbi:MAG: protein-export chaperone SecB [Desulfobacterales bacterium]|nr:protein-export chaperone SecB [Desulfobacterales bacterium]
MKKKRLFKPHPINVESVHPRQLSIEALVPPSQDVDVDDLPLTISVGHSEYDAKRKAFSATLRLQTPKNTPQAEELPFSLKVEIWAAFSVDETRFSKDDVQDWATRNAPFVLYPYLREHVYALTARCGFRPLLLPLVEVPTFKLAPQKKTRTATKPVSKKTTKKD